MVRKKTVREKKIKASRPARPAASATRLQDPLTSLKSDTEPGPPEKPGSAGVAAAAEEDGAFPVVGIGASAGGLEAFTLLLKHLPGDTGMAFVFIQHLDPTHASMLTEILGHSTKMPIAEVRTGMRVEPNRVFVIPPGQNLGLIDGVFQLVPRAPGRRREMPVDYFLETLADSLKTRAIGVVLSGTLSDGALGLQAVKAEGGVTFAQDESSAKFQDMPRAAIAAGVVDFVLSPEGIANELGRLARHPHVALPKKPQAQETEAAETGDHARIFQILKTATGVDFSNYRPSTIRRRITRRMALNKVERVEDYLRFLRENRAEVHKLYEDILITVTGFFRDPENFKVLRDTVFPDIAKNRSADTPIRVWVPGCSTGEEVYSIAITLFECLGDSGANPPIQIFATDISESAINRARNGIYLENALVDVSPERLRRFFVRADSGFQISKSIRDVCVFARQNVAVDPPFSNLDFLSCRNLLIYFEPILQKRIIPIFHYALKPKGFLMLGSAETLATFPALFYPIDRNHRIFAKKPGAPRPFLDLGHGRHEETPSAEKPPDPVRSALDLQKEADRLVLNRYAPPGVLVNDAFDVLQFRGRTSAYLEPPPGTASLNVLKMAREGLLFELRDALLKAKRSGAQVRKEGVRLRSNGSVTSINIEVSIIRQAAGERHFLVLFEEEKPKEPERPAAARKKTRERRAVEVETIATLEQELTATKDYLQSIIEEQEASNEELRSANEEILSSNEELQSTNEELETAKEELQSSNEELTTVNEEMQNRNLELSQLNNDLTNVFTSINMPIVMLAAQGQIRRFTAPAEKLLNLIPGDIGRPIGDIKTNVNVPDLGGIVLEVVDTVRPVEREVQDSEGRWHMMRVRPYRTLDNRIDGAVVVFSDIDLLKRSLTLANRASEYATALLDMLNTSLLILDRDLRIRSANRAFYETFRTVEAQTLGKPLFDLGDEWRGEAPKLRTALENVLATRQPLAGFEFEIEFEQLGRKLLRTSARPVIFPGDASSSLVVALEDLTDRKMAEEASRQFEARYRRLFETVQEGIWLQDAKTAKIVDANPFLLGMLGYSRDELVGSSPWEVGLFSTPSAAQLRFSDLVREGYAYDADVEMKTKAGETIAVEAISSTYLSGNRMIVQSNVRDITDRRRLEAELRQVQKLESIGRLAGGIAHDFNNILNIISAHAALAARGQGEKSADSREAIRKAVERGAGLVRQLLTFARRGEIEVKSVDVNGTVQEVSELIGETFPKKIQIQLELAAELPPIQADPSQLHQALLNLCVNARDAMPQGGKLEIATRLVSREELRGRPGPFVQIRVSDDGEGMGPETRNRIFEPFFTTKGPEGGSGLGLAVVYGVVNGHGGFIDVDSEPGRGTSFRLNFPVSSAGAEKLDEETEEPAAAAGGEGSDTILLVEDERMLLEPVRSLLESEGYRILAAEDGREALEVFSRHEKEITILFADIGLPRMDGWEVFQRIKKSNPAIKAVLASGLVDVEQRRRMTDAGVQAVLRKPYTAGEIIRTLRGVARTEPVH